MFHVCPSPCLQVGMGAHITFLSRQIYREDAITSRTLSPPHLVPVTTLGLGNRYQVWAGDSVLLVIATSRSVMFTNG